MKRVFIWTFLALACVSAAAWKMQRPEDRSRILLTWVSDDNPVRQEQVALFNKLNPSCRLRLDPGNSGTEKVVVQSLAGVGPDLFDCNSASELEAYVKSGVAWDITDELKKNGIDIRNQEWPVLGGVTSSNGRIYGVPGNASGGGGALWYNKEIFDKCKVPYPKSGMTWEQLVPIAQKLTIRDKNGRVQQYGLLCDWSSWPQFIYQWGGRVYNNNGTKCVIYSKESVAAIAFMQDLVYKYHIMPTPVEESTMATKGGWGSGSISLFGGGKAAMAMGGRWWLCTLRDYDLRLGAVEQPYGPVRCYVGGGRSTVINKNSLHKKEALLFLKYLYSREYNELVNRQADGISPVKKYAYTSQYLHDPKHPEEDYNAVWRDPMKYAKPMPGSPFIAGQVDYKIINKQMDLVKNNQKSVDDALKTAERQINAEIKRSISIDPTLRKRYEALNR